MNGECDAMDQEFVKDIEEKWKTGDRNKSLTEIGFGIVYMSDVVSPEDLQKLEKIKRSLMKTFDNRIIWRTPIEAEIGVLNDIDCPTPAAKYHQAALEQAAFFDNLIRLSFDYRRKLLDLEDIESKMESLTPGSIEYRRLQIDKEEALYTLYTMFKEGSDRVREILMWEEFKERYLKEDPDIDPTSKVKDQIRWMALSLIRRIPTAIDPGTEPAVRDNILALAARAIELCDREGVNLGEEGDAARSFLRKRGYQL